MATTMIKNCKDHVMEFEVLDLEKEVDKELFIETFTQTGAFAGLVKPGHKVQISSDKGNFSISVKTRNGFTYESFLKEHSPFLETLRKYKVFEKEK